MILATTILPMWHNTKTIRYSYEPNEKELVLKFELAGKTKENVKVFNKHNAVNVKVDNKETYSVDLDHPYYDHIEYDTSNMTATMQHGLLTVRVPRKNDKLYEIEIE